MGSLFGGSSMLSISPQNSAIFTSCACNSYSQICKCSRLAIIQTNVICIKCYVTLLRENMTFRWIFSMFSKHFCFNFDHVFVTLENFLAFCLSVLQQYGINFLKNMGDFPLGEGLNNCAKTLNYFISFMYLLCDNRSVSLVWL